MMILFNLIYFSVLVQAQLTVVTTTNLSFGKIAAGSGGTVTISATGVRSTTGGVIALSSASGSAAAFQLSGTPSVGYIVTVPTNGTVTMTSGANSMAVNDFTVSPAFIGVLTAGGTQTINIGATLTVDINKPQGDYSGTFPIIVNYQ